MLPVSPAGQRQCVDRLRRGVTACVFAEARRRPRPLNPKAGTVKVAIGPRL